MLNELYTLLTSLLRVIFAFVKVLYKGKNKGRKSAEILHQVILELGPAYIKFAQILATRTDVIGKRLADVLSSFYDDVPAMTIDEFELELNSAYGKEWDMLFEKINPIPIGTGSIACVYEAIYNGRLVALKIRRPKVDVILINDISKLILVFSFIERIPGFRGIPLREMSKTIGKSIIDQSDFFKEAISLQNLFNDLCIMKNKVLVPQPIHELSQKNILVMDYIQSDSGTQEVFPLEKYTEISNTILLITFNLIFGPSISSHCDLHPGNLRYEQNSNKLVVVDAGFVFDIPNYIKYNLAIFFLNLSFRKGETCAQAILSSCKNVPATAKVNRFIIEVTKLVDRYGGTCAKDFNLVDFATRLFVIQKKNGVYPESLFIFPILALLMVEPLVRSITPESNFQEIARPIVYRSIKRLDPHSGS